MFYVKSAGVELIFAVLPTKCENLQTQATFRAEKKHYYKAA